MLVGYFCSAHRGKPASKEHSRDQKKMPLTSLAEELTVPTAFETGLGNLWRRNRDRSLQGMGFKKRVAFLTVSSLAPLKFHFFIVVKLFCNRQNTGSWGGVLGPGNEFGFVPIISVT